MSRVEENKEKMQEINKKREELILTNPCIELREINKVLMDISKSLAIIADAIDKKKTQ